ncbi:MAG: glutaredoxin domain-containing protein [Kiritimatiellia bacterium]
MKPAILIYHAEICGLCHKAMDWMRSRGLEFEAVEVFWDSAHDHWVDDANSRRMLQECGNVDFVPQIFINGHHIMGWRRLEPMIRSGEIESILKG